MKQTELPAQIARRFLNSRGMNLTELMVAMSILSIAVLGFVSSFQFITKSIHVSRGKTLAVNLAQEKIENLKDISYHKLLLSTVTTTDANFNPSITYDTINYPEETIIIGGMTFFRRTHVAFAEVTDNMISTISFNYPDPGLKLVKTYIIWTQNTIWKKVELQNLYENPNVDPLNATIGGTVKDDSANVIEGAVVEVLENTDWTDTSDSSGIFSFEVHAGTYSVRASSAGYFSQTKTDQEANTGTPLVLSFTLTPMDTGNVSGQAYYNDHLVISQIVAATNTYYGGKVLKLDVEYVELFNPTTFAINIGVDAADHDVGIEYDDEQGAGNDIEDNEFALVYHTTYVAPGGFYLIASTKNFYIGGQLIEADATYGDTSGADHIDKTDAGCLWLYNMNDPTNIIDRVAWCDDTISGTPPHYCTVPASCGEDYPIPDSTGADGPLALGTQIIRTSSPTAIFDSYGPAFDTGHSLYDFVYATSGWNGQIVLPPRSSLDAAQPVISGKPAFEANITADDLLGPTTKAYAIYIASGAIKIPTAFFQLEGVSTGTWNVLVATGASYTLHAGVAVTDGVTTGIPNSATSPPEDLSGHYAVRMQSSTVEGFIAGSVTGVNGEALPGITVTAGGTSKTTGANGRYFAMVSSGSITVVANPSNANSSYIESIAQPNVNTGELTTQDFVLSQGGVISGFVTTDGSSVLPNIEVAAKISGLSYGSGTSDSSGNFYIRNMSTGTYDIEPVLDTAQSYSPTGVEATVTSTATIDVGTFTIAGALGTIYGDISYDGSPLTSGALILASTETIGVSPSKIVASSSPAQTFIYAASSKADGTYTMDVRGGADTYFISAFVPTILGDNSVIVTTVTYSGISVTASQSTQKDIAVAP